MYLFSKISNKCFFSFCQPDNKNREMPYMFLQYLYKSEEHIKHHGNSKKAPSYRRVLPSTQEKLKESLKMKSTTAQEALDTVHCSVGDVTSQSLGQLPSGPKDIYNARYSAKKLENQGNECKDEDSKKQTSDSLCLNSMWTLLEQAKREEEVSKESIFIRECTIHPDFFVVLANDSQLQGLVQFCTSPKEFCVSGVDPTCNIFRQSHGYHAQKPQA